MTYSFEFYSSKWIYYEGGSETKKKAMSKLEEISRAHCKIENPAIGKIFEIILPVKNKDCKIKLLEEYNISNRNGEIILKRK